MPTDSPQSIYVEYTPEFKRSLRTLARKYRSIRTDVKPIIKRLQAGDLIGVRLREQAIP
jgi:mRNA-degrading endonuclease RelE of RelBE toxin-antitoxin system